MNAAGETISLGGRYGLVTGAASGIGAAIAGRLAAAGAGGACIDRAPSVARPDGWIALEADVRCEDAVHDACRAAARELGGHLDFVVAAAGIVPPWRKLAALDLAEWEEVFAINVRGVAATLKHATPLMRTGGSIVVLASLNAWRGDGNLTSYTASKHAVLGIVRSAAIDLGSRGVRVNAIGPGPVATDALLARVQRRAQAGGLEPAAALAAFAEQTSLGRIATTDDVAAAALFLVSDLAAAVTGQLLAVDGGLP